MKVLFFSSYFYPHISGLTIYPYRIFKHLSKNHKITVLTFNNSLKIAHPELAEWKNLKLKIISLPFLFKISKGFYAPLAKFYFFKYCLKNDVIILNLPNGEGLFLALFAKLFHKKLISIFHCQVTLSHSLINQLINSFLKIIINIQLHLSDHIITNTQDYFENLHLSPTFGKKISYVFPPIQLEKVNSDELKQFLKVKGGKIWIGYLGRISSEKGIEYLIEAMRTIVAEIHLPIELIFAGQSLAIHEEKYFQLIKQQLIKSKIIYRFFNKLKDNQISAFYKSLDIFVLPSINTTESFGMAQVEAIISGTPVIATDLPGIRIPLNLSKMGIIVKPKNSSQIKSAILKILKNKQKYSNKQLINNAKQIFDVQKTFNFYDATLISTGAVATSLAQQSNDL